MSKRRKGIEIGEHQPGLSPKRFVPDNLECIIYLIRKVAGDPLPCGKGVILDLDIYDEYQLPRLFMAAMNRDVYFFTHLRLKGKSGKSGPKNAERTIGNGTFKGDNKREVWHNDIGVVGTVHGFHYEKKGSGHDGCFLMSEYHLPDDICPKYHPLEKPVLCVLRYKHKSDDGSIKRRR